MKIKTEKVNELIEKEYRGNKTMFAEKIGVDAHYFCQVLRGKASNSSPKIIKGIANYCKKNQLDCNNYISFF